MKHTKITVGFATLLCIFSLAGCQSKPQNQPVETETEMQQTNTVSEPQTEQPQQAILSASELALVMTPSLQMRCISSSIPAYGVSLINLAVIIFSLLVFEIFIEMSFRLFPASVFPIALRPQPLLPLNGIIFAEKLDKKARYGCVPRNTSRHNSPRYIHRCFSWLYW